MIYHEYNLPLDLLDRVKKSLNEIYKYDMDEMNDLM